MERKNKTNRDISSFIPTLRAGQEAGTKGMPEKSGTPTALVRHAAPDCCSLQLISVLQDSSRVPGFPGGAGDTQTAAEHPWLAPCTVKHSIVSFPRILQAFLNGITYPMAGPAQPHPADFWWNKRDRWPGLVSRSQKDQCPTDWGAWDQLHLGMLQPPLLDQRHSQRGWPHSCSSPLPALSSTLCSLCCR